MEKKKSKSTIKDEASKKPAPRQASQTRKSSEKDKVSMDRKKRSSSTGKVASGEAKNVDDKARKENNKKENLKSVEAIDIPPAEVKS